MVVCGVLGLREMKWVGKRPGGYGVEEEESPLAPPICYTLTLTKKIQVLEGSQRG